MNHKDILNIYSEGYAKEYNERFLLNPFSKLGSDFELSLLKELISSQTNWLDIGCGTGYFLSQFPGIKRAGLDISPFMLQEAKRVNPDALFFKEGDFRNEYPELNNKWSLITCMWNPYSYIDSLFEFDRVIANIVNWTSNGGNVFIPVMDIEDFRFDTPVTYEEKIEMYNGVVQINGFTWSWIEDGSNLNHAHMIAPHVEHVISLLSPFFETVELVRYPPFRTGWVSRKAVLAKGKISGKDSHEAKVIRHPIPSPLHNDAAVNNSPATTELYISNKQLVGELFRRLKSGHLFRSLLKKIKPS